MPDNVKPSREQEFAEKSLRAAGERGMETEAIQIVDHWNTRLAQGNTPQFSPTIACAIRARKPFLRVYCSGCKQECEIDLRLIVRAPDTPIMALRAALVCETLCRGQGPAPKLLCLAEDPYDRKKYIHPERAKAMMAARRQFPIY